MKKIAYIKNVKNSWWEDAYSLSCPPGSAPDHKLQKPSKESGVYFSHLAPLVLFFFIKKQSQKRGGGMAQCRP